VRGEKVVTRRREDEMILQCVRSHLDPLEAERTDVLARQDLDWEYLIQAALVHKVLPIVYHSLHTFCPEALPNLIMQQLRELYQANARRNLLLASELVRLVKLLECAGISVIAFKGPVLALYAYGNLSLRQQLDLDILVRKIDIFRAKQVLQSNGYRLSPEMTQEQEAALLRSQNAFVFLPEPPTHNVDLHWAIAQPHHVNGLNQEALWKRVEPVSLGGNDVATFRPEEMMLVLSMHGTKHCWQQLSWICDIAQLIRSRPDLDWQRVIREAETASCIKGLLVALELVKGVCAVRLPEEVVQLIDGDRRVKAVGRSVIRQLFADKQSVLMRFHRIFIVSRLKQRVRDRFLYLLYEWREAVTPNAKDQALISLPIAFSFLYYVVRPLRLTVAYGLSRLIRSAKP
jgi:Uncharacterised nucleotidyltransferase